MAPCVKFEDNTSLQTALSYVAGRVLHAKEFQDHVELEHAAKTFKAINTWLTQNRISSQEIEAAYTK